MSGGDATSDQRFMAAALRAGAQGSPSPNPHVGAVVVKKGKLLSRGHHARCGGPHAEVVALQRAGRAARGATLYVTCTPCNHHGRTGPCTDAVIESRVARVVIGTDDPAPHVPGAVKRLRAAGIEVTTGVQRHGADALIADFRKFALEGLPFITLKAAVTLDGRIAARSGDSRWITGEAARKEAHRMRARSDAVMVGSGTALCDDPALTVRHVRGRDPLRVVLDSRLRLDPGSRLLQHRSSAPTLVFHGPEVSGRRRTRLAREGVELLSTPTDRAGKLRLRPLLRELGRRGVVRLLVEGGAGLHGALLDAGLADRAAIFVAPRILGDPAAVPLANGKPRRRIADAYQLQDVDVKRLGDDVLMRGNLVGARSLDRRRGQG